MVVLQEEACGCTYHGRTSSDSGVWGGLQTGRALTATDANFPF